MTLFLFFYFLNSTQSLKSMICFSIMFFFLDSICHLDTRVNGALPVNELKKIKMQIF